MSVRTSVRPSTKCSFDFNEIWSLGRGRRLMHDGMQYDQIQGQGHGHEPLKVGNSAIFKGYLACLSLSLSVPAPRGAGVPLPPFLPLSIYFLIFALFCFSLFPFFICFTYFLLLSIFALSTRIVPLRFHAGGRRRRPNMGLVCCFVLSVLLS